MNIDIRKYIIANFQEDNCEEIKKSIEVSIDSHEDDPLLGLGVFFELLWKNSDEETKEKNLKIIEKAIKKNK